MLDNVGGIAERSGDIIMGHPRPRIEWASSPAGSWMADRIGQHHALHGPSATHH